ncbi:MAG: hypothetical protein WCQ21_19310, partial [Verrucomicrobiota bacterium]
MLPSHATTTAASTAARDIDARNNCAATAHAAATALLPTALPAPQKPVPGAPLFAKYRDVPWLARKVAIAQLPSVGALATLRALPQRQKQQ